MFADYFLFFLVHNVICIQYLLAVNFYVFFINFVINFKDYLHLDIWYEHRKGVS